MPAQAKFASGRAQTSWSLNLSAYTRYVYQLATDGRFWHVQKKRRKKVQSNHHESTYGALSHELNGPWSPDSRHVFSNKFSVISSPPPEKYKNRNGMQNKYIEKLQKRSEIIKKVKDVRVLIQRVHPSGWCVGRNGHVRVYKDAHTHGQIYRLAHTRAHIYTHTQHAPIPSLTLMPALGPLKCTLPLITDCAVVAWNQKLDCFCHTPISVITLLITVVPIGWLPPRASGPRGLS